MSRLHQVLSICTALLLAAGPRLAAQERTLGLLRSDADSYHGYTLFAPNGATSTYLIDHCGRRLHSWQAGGRPGLAAYLLPNGHLLRTGTLANGTSAPFMAGGAGGRVEEFDWDGTLLWEFEYASDRYRLHHDIELLPNGNLLMIAWELKTREEAIAAGRNPALLPDNELWPDMLIEVRPNAVSGGDIVWKWHMWDHLVQDFDSGKANFGDPAEHPELMDINFVSGNGGADWNHTNAVDYNADLDQIILSLHHMSEIIVIDHSTTSAEAAGNSGGNVGRGGDILYRWGNPRTYRAGTTADQQLFVQHDAQWIAEGLPGAGNILVFNNGGGRSDGDYSSVVEIAPPLLSDGSYELAPSGAYGPAAPLWQYRADDPSTFYARNISGAQRLPNGNTLICNGPAGTFFEVRPDGKTVWEYVSPVAGRDILRQGDLLPDEGNSVNAVFRCYRYAPEYAGIPDKNLEAGAPIELDPLPDDCGTVSSVSEEARRGLRVFPSPATTALNISYTNQGSQSCRVYDALGQLILRTELTEQTTALDVSDWRPGVYILKVGDMAGVRIIIAR